MDAGDAVADAGPAVLHVLRREREPPAAHAAAGAGSRRTYKGKFDQGWDKLREEILARQIKMGIMPPGTKLAENPPRSAEVGHALGRRQEGLCAADGGVCDATEHADYEVGRLVKGIEELGELDNTLFIYIFGDNGGIDRRRPERHFHRVVQPQRRAGGHALSAVPPGRVRRAELLSELRRRLGHGRLHAGHLVHHACQGGGKNAGMVVHWPKGIKAKGEIRRQYTH